jgi:hypothetical protein
MLGPYCLPQHPHPLKERSAAADRRLWRAPSPSGTGPSKRKEKKYFIINYLLIYNLLFLNPFLGPCGGGSLISLSLSRTAERDQREDSSVKRQGCPRPSTLFLDLPAPINPWIGRGRSMGAGKCLPVLQPQKKER